MVVNCVTLASEKNTVTEISHLINLLIKAGEKLMFIQWFTI